MLVLPMMDGQSIHYATPVCTAIFFIAKFIWAQMHCAYVIQLMLPIAMSVGWKECHMCERFYAEWCWWTSKKRSTRTYQFISADRLLYRGNHALMYALLFCRCSCENISTPTSDVGIIIIYPFYVFNWVTFEYVVWISFGLACIFVWGKVCSSGGVLKRHLSLGLKTWLCLGKEREG